ncbi:DUF309 domain-containing protein ['Paenibacillus yunnanensis' Narsing Rao et al. 2020]|uniref:DUF309 domain-containing protein n=1 Tax=Paenibacillus tengchongensis TaxID=2608684 RepID=UPI00124DF956|nr:DUF309 domain-containing protein [Paenibacillus tengchongensis]
MGYEPLYLAYLVYFNRDRDYFECHEVLEELWLAKDRDPLYKALLQVAVGLYHFRNGNVRGGTLMLENAHRVLREYPDRTLGIDMGKLVRETGVYTLRLERYAEEPFAYYDLTLEITDPELARAVEAAAGQIEPNQQQQRGPRPPRPKRHK